VTKSPGEKQKTKNISCTGKKTRKKSLPTKPGKENLNKRL
jgi:hypothetical protein